MLANGVLQTCTGGGTAALTLSTVSGALTFAAAFGQTGSGGRPFLYTIRRQADGLRVEHGVGRIAADGTLTRDYIIETYDGTTQTFYGGTAYSLAGGTQYDVECADSDATRAGAIQFSDSGISGSKILGGANWLVTPSAGISPGADTMHVVPFQLERPALVSAIGLHLTTASTTGATQTARAAIYVQDHAGRVAVPLAETSSVAVNTGASTRKDMALSSNIRLLPGWVWIAVCTDSNAAFSGSNAAIPMKPCPAWGISSSTSRYTRMTRSLTYASTGTLFPNLTGLSASTYGTDAAGNNPVYPMLVLAN